MEESKLNEIGEWLNTQGYEIDLKDHFWMEEFIFDEFSIRDIAEMLFDYERRESVSDENNSLHEHIVSNCALSDIRKICNDTTELSANFNDEEARNCDKALSEILIIVEETLP